LLFQLRAYCSIIKSSIKSRSRELLLEKMAIHASNRIENGGFFKELFNCNCGLLLFNCESGSLQFR